MYQNLAELYKQYKQNYSVPTVNTAYLAGNQTFFTELAAATRDLGILSVKGLSLVARPPARIATCIGTISSPVFLSCDNNNSFG